MKRWSIIAILILAFAGLADDFYLAQHETSGTPLICNIQNFSGCNIVANSVYSHVFGIPVAYFGVLLFSGIFIAAALELVFYNRLLRRILQVLALIGVLFSIASTAIQVFLIHALCIYCLASGVISLLIFFFATGIEPIRRRAETTPEGEGGVLPMPPV